MKHQISFIAAALFTGSIALACMTQAPPFQKGDKPKSFVVYRTGKRLPASNVATQIPEFAKQHKTPSLAARLGTQMIGRNDVIISAPIQLEKSNYHPFGDKQVNANMKVPDWKGTGLPVLGIQSVKNGKKIRTYQFDPVLKVKDFKEVALENGWFKVQVQGRSDWFYFFFDTGVMPVSEFIKGIPEANRKFGERLAPDPAKVGKGGGSERIKSMDLGDGYNKEAWPVPQPDGTVHGRFPDRDGMHTAIGAVLTWGNVSEETGKFKHLYTCFEARDVESENQLGVPSGAGWHFVGDGAETIVNSLETASIPVAIARTHGFENPAMGMKEVLTASWLKSDEALITRRGEFHWYLNPYPHDVCTEIWVHNCEPSISNNWGFNCPRDY